MKVRLIALMAVASIVFSLLFWLTKSDQPTTDTQVDQINESNDESLDESLDGTIPPAAEAQSEATVSPQSAPSQQAPPKAMVLDQSAAPQPAQGRRPLPEGGVPYRVENGMMITYGDIVLGQPPDDAPGEGYAVMPTVNPWKSKEIAYYISPKLGFADRIQRVLNYFNENTPVRFVPLTNQKDAIAFEPGEQHCRSYLGKIGGHQPIFLSAGCTEPEIAHEIMHALGFVHEQSRPDRDRFIKINWDKIEQDKQDQFDVVPDSLAKTTDGRPFDYRSVMLYDPTAFARTPGDITIESRTGTPIEPTQSGLSLEDLERLHILYR